MVAVRKVLTSFGERVYQEFDSGSIPPATVSDSTKNERATFLCMAVVEKGFSTRLEAEFIKKKLI